MCVCVCVCADDSCCIILTLRVFFNNHVCLRGSILSLFSDVPRPIFLRVCFHGGVCVHCNHGLANHATNHYPFYSDSDGEKVNSDS